MSQSSQTSNEPELYERNLQDVNQMLKYAKIGMKLNFKV